MREFLAANVPIGLSIDTTVLCGNADMFAIMKVMQNIADGTAPSEFGITARRVLEMGTMGGARALGLADHIGSLTPGKRADLILVRTGDINMAPMADPIHEQRRIKNQCSRQSLTPSSMPVLVSSVWPC